jgi:hypothetical protein
MDKTTFLRDYTRAVREGSAALFVGAGISRAAGYVDWKQLLTDIAEELNLDIDRETDLVSLAQYYVNHHEGNRSRLNRVFIDQFLEDATLTESHRLIASLPISTIWTTNYDTLIEDAFKDASKRLFVKRRKSDFPASRKRLDATLYKMHGDAQDPADAILTKEDYESYDSTREVFTNSLKSDLSEKTFLFLGVSFTDPNVNYVLSRVRRLLEQNAGEHYCLLKAPGVDPNNPENTSYQTTQFNHWLKDLKRYHIRPVIIDSYDEVPVLLRELNRRAHLQDIFISGAAHDYEPLGKEKFGELTRKLSAELIKKDFNIISGFGLVVGGDVIIGATESLRRNDDQRLQLWPFPQEVPSGSDRAAMWRQYRERMIANAGICIVLGGNKLDGENVVLSPGIRQEVEIAQTGGKFVVPIGATGYVAKELWDECMRDPTRFVGTAKVQSQLAVIGDANQSVASIIDATIYILKQLDR